MIKKNKLISVLIYLLACLIFFLPGLVFAELDDLQLRLQYQFELPLRWDNVEGAPEWVSGEAPGYHFKPGLHLVRLEPGESTTVRVPQGSRLRLYNPLDVLLIDEVSVQHSNGSGLYAKLPVAVSKDGHSLLTYADISRPNLIRVTNSAVRKENNEALVIALFISRFEPIGDIAPYRNLISLALPTVQMRRSDQAASQTYWQLQPGNLVSVKVAGPARYALVHRLVYPNTESRLLQTYRIFTSLNGDAFHTLAFETSIEQSAPIYVDWRESVMGREKVGYIDIPEGEHELQLDATAMLNLRLLLQDQSDYLFPGFNAPKITARDILQQDISRPRKTSWTLDQKQIEQGISDIFSFPSDWEYLAQRLAWDNRHQGGGMLATMLMRASASQYRYDNNVQTVASEMQGFYTFYRDLLPAYKIDDQAQNFNWFITKQLHNLGEQRKKPVGDATQHIGSLVNQLSSGYFVNLPYYVPGVIAEVINPPVEVDGTNLISMVLFDSNQIDIRPEDENKLIDVARFVQQHTNGEIHIVGHTDDQAYDSYNQILSEKRARNVADFLLQHGVNEHRLIVSGKGEDESSALNEDSVGRQLNRRVEISYITNFVDSPCINVNCYYLPARAEPGLLRVIVDLDASAVDATFMIQFGGGEPVQMAINTGQLLAETEYVSGQAALGLQMLQQKNNDLLYEPTLSGVFGRKHVLAHKIRAGTFEFVIPTDIRQVKIWRSGSQDDNVQLALQYRAAKPFVLSEMEYLEMIRRLPQGRAAYRQFVTKLSVAEEDVLASHWVPLMRFLKLQYQLYGTGVAVPEKTMLYSEVLSEMEYLEMIRQLPQGRAAYHQFVTKLSVAEGNVLANHWVPLMRFLKLQYQLYGAGVAVPEKTMLYSEKLDQVTINNILVQAEQAQTKGQWLTALEMWSQILHANNVAQEIQRKAQMAQIYALQQLGEHYLMEQQLRGLLLHSEDVLLSQMAFDKLDTYYRENNEPEKLQSLLASMIKMHPTPEYLMLLAEVLLDNGVYDMALMLALLVPENKQQLHTTIRAAYHLGWWEVFDELWKQLPDPQLQQFWLAQRSIEQSDYSAALEQFNLAGELGEVWARSLNDGLAIRQDLMSDTADHQQTIFQWQRWQAQHPGPFKWREARHLVKDYSGMTTLYNHNRDIYMQTFLADARKPVKVSFMGPLQLLVEARPVHATGSLEPIDDWLQLRTKDGLRVVPISNNMAVENLSMVGDSERSVGQRVSDILSFGPGLHEIEFSGQHASLLLRIFEQRPELDLGVLPSINPETIALWLNKSFTSFNFFEVDSVVEEEHDILASFAATYLANEEIDAAITLYSEQTSGSSVNMSPEYRSDVLRHMTLLLWLAEQQPDQHQRAIVLAEALLASHPTMPQLRLLLSRLTRHAGWLPVSNVQGSAGLRYIEVTGWQPESLVMRVRKALLGPVQQNEHIINGAKLLVVSLNNFYTTTFKLKLTQQDVRYLSPAPLTVVYQIDENQPIQVVLTAENLTQTRQIHVPGGEHVLRIWLVNPVTNQFLRVQLAEIDGASLVYTVERHYHVATSKKPLKVGMLGPAWLRITNWHEGKLLTNYRFIESGWQDIEIIPEPGDEERLVRLSQRLLVREKQEIANRQTDSVLDPVPGALVSLRKIDNNEQTKSTADIVLGPYQQQNQEQVLLHDGFPLGGQEDGTWSINAAGVSRRNFGDNSGDNSSERFFESSLTHRYYNNNLRTYFKTDILGRSRQQGAPTFGIVESLVYRPFMVPVDFKLDGRFYLQQFNQSGDKDKEWSVFFRASVSQKRNINPKTWYVPELSFFQQELSLPTSTPDNDRLDQDIFTQYKADHKRGVGFSNRVVHRPWLDTLWHSRFSAISNENSNLFKPDHILLSAGWRQLIADFEVDASYRMVRFFADKIRNQSFNRHSLILNLAWNKWHFNQQQIETGVRYRRDFDISSNNGLLYVSWHFGNGRMYKDFQPNEVNFLDLRQRSIPQTINNHIGSHRD